MEIKYIDFGIAYAYNKTIEMNKILLRHSKLYKMILQHEIEHIKNPSFFDTLRIDFRDMFNFEKQALINELPFKIRLQAILPIWIYKGQICTNPFLIVFYLLLILGIIVIQTAIIC